MATDQLLQINYLLISRNNPLCFSSTDSGDSGRYPHCHGRLLALSTACCSSGAGFLPRSTEIGRARHTHQARVRSLARNRRVAPCLPPPQARHRPSSADTHRNTAHRHVLVLVLVLVLLSDGPNLPGPGRSPDEAGPSVGAGTWARGPAPLRHLGGRGVRQQSRFLLNLVRNKQLRLGR